MSIKYITERTSKTGEKFVALHKLADEAMKAQNDFAKKYKIKEWRASLWTVWGGFSSVSFKDIKKVDEKIWKNVNKSKYEWMPRMSTVVGKQIFLEMDKLPRVDIKTLNDCIGMNGSPFRRIGVNYNSEKYVGFSVNEEWNVKVPPDCKEVTYAEFRETFNIKK